MIKKIKVEQLKPGIFIHDFNSGWLHHPFLRNQIKLRTDDDIAKILKYHIREVYIDTERGVDVDDAPTKQDVEREIQQHLKKIREPVLAVGNRVPLRQEMARAKALIREGKSSVHQLMDDVQSGEPIEMAEVERLVDRISESVFNNKDALLSLARIKNKDEYTYLHCLAVSALCIAFGAHLGFDHQQMKKIGTGGLLHDIGKVRIPSAVLNKPGPLSEKEFEVMKEHVRIGECILKDTTRIEEDSLCVTAHHHERLDGTGYPEGLKGDRISLFGRVAAIVDIYDALTSERCYKDAVSPTEALRKIFEWSDSYLDRELVERFIAFLGIYPIGTVVRMRSGFIGLVIRQGQDGLLYPTVRAIYDARRQTLIRPFDISLARRSTNSNVDEIVGCELPKTYNIRLERYLL